MPHIDKSLNLLQILQLIALVGTGLAFIFRRFFKGEGESATLEKHTDLIKESAKQQADLTITVVKQQAFIEAHDKRLTTLEDRTWEMQGRKTK